MGDKQDRSRSILQKLFFVLSDYESRHEWYINFKRKMGLPYEKSALKLKYKLLIGGKMNLRKPRTLCEKLNWLKINYRKPEFTEMVDKFEAKKYVEKRVGPNHVIPTLGIWENADDIDFEILPNKFVLKPTHDSGGLIICKDKSKLNIADARKKLNDSLSHDFYERFYEWPYKNVKHRIIAEPLIEQLGQIDSIEYKTTCFNGKVGFVTICTGIAHDENGNRFNDHFDRDFNRLSWKVYYEPAPISPQKPEQWDELIEFCEKLSKDIPYLRVDTYIIDGKILFGEMTFYTWGGIMKFEPKEWDLKLGHMLKLPKKYKKGK